MAQTSLVQTRETAAREQRSRTAQSISQETARTLELDETPAHAGPGQAGRGGGQNAALAGSSLPAPRPNKPQKSQYSEAEVAVELGITLDALRSILRNHVVDQDEDLNNVPATSFQPSDLLVLRLLAGMAPKPIR